MFHKWFESGHVDVADEEECVVGCVGSHFACDVDGLVELCAVNSFYAHCLAAGVCVEGFGDVAAEHILRVCFLVFQDAFILLLGGEEFLGCIAEVCEGHVEQLHHCGEVFGGGRTGDVACVAVKPHADAHLFALEVFLEVFVGVVAKAVHLSCNGEEYQRVGIAVGEHGCAAESLSVEEDFVGFEVGVFHDYNRAI